MDKWQQAEWNWRALWRSSWNVAKSQIKKGSVQAADLGHSSASIMIFAFEPENVSSMAQIVRISANLIESTLAGPY